jgi:hypothetical protein
MKLFKSKAKEIKELQPEENEVPAPEGREADENFAPPAKLPEIKRPLPKPLSRPAPSQSPPLFIKVDKYRDVVRNIRELRSYILNLRDALDVLKDMQREIANGIEIAQKTLDELNSITSSLDSFFMKPQTMERPEEYGEREDLEESDEVDTSMRDVYGQLEKLRAQLRAIG